MPVASNPSLGVEKVAYRGILKSAALLGSARGITMAIGLVRVKFLALILGPTGIGLSGALETIVTTTIYLCGLGVSSSGVREIAVARSGGNQKRIAQTVTTLQRLSWVLGLVGTIAVAALAWPIAELTFKSHARGFDILILSPAIILTSVICGFNAIIQGMQRIADVAKLTVISALISGASVAILAGIWGERGIAPSFALSVLLQLPISAWYTRKLELTQSKQTWWETLRGSGAFIRLGVGFTYALLLSSLVNYTIQALIARELSLDAVGIYLCAFGLSGKFLGFILDAMRTDFYPRLSAAASDDLALNRLVNQQTEIVLLLAMPGLLATLALAPWLVRAFYSAKFDQAAALMPWFILACLARVIWNPLGYVQLAKSRSVLYTLTATIISMFKIVIVVVLLKNYGLQGIVLAYLCNELFQMFAMVVACRLLTGFKWSTETVRLLFPFVAIAIGCAAVSLYVNRIYAAMIVGSATAGVSIYCMRQLALRLGTDHRIMRVVARVPVLGNYLQRT
jgi:PST family polysaccharide transporter